MSNVQKNKNGPTANNKRRKKGVTNTIKSLGQMKRSENNSNRGLVDYLANKNGPTANNKNLNKLADGC